MRREISRERTRVAGDGDAVTTSRDYGLPRFVAKTIDGQKMRYGPVSGGVNKTLALVFLWVAVLSWSGMVFASPARLVGSLEG